MFHDHHKIHRGGIIFPSPGQQPGTDQPQEECRGGGGVARVAEVALAEAHELPLVVLLHIRAPFLVVTWWPLEALTLGRDSKVVVAKVFVMAFQDLERKD